MVTLRSSDEGDHISSEQPPAIVAEALHKRYGSTVAVDGVSLSIGHGECFGILGPNGAGKTTTLEIIEGLRQPDSGEVQVLGLAPWPRNPALLPRIGVQLQASAFFEKLTAIEQLRTFAGLYGVPARNAAEKLEMVGLADRADIDASQLSGGQRQRLSIACALVHEPEVVFLDEPSAGLDPIARRSLWTVLSTIREQGVTIVLTTHHMEEAEVLCERVAIMDGGRIVADGTPLELVRGLDAPTTILLSAAAVSVERARSIDGVLDVAEASTGVSITTRRPGPVLEALASMDALDGLQVRSAGLEDVYVAVTGREYRPELPDADQVVPEPTDPDEVDR